MNTWWYFRHSSPSHWTVSVSGATTRQRVTLPSVDEPVQDQRRLDRLAEADFVRQQPPNRIGRTGAFGHVQLMREQPDTATKERSQAIGLAQRQQVQDVHPRHEIVHIVEVAEGQALEQRAFELQRPQRVCRAFPPGPARRLRRQCDLIVVSSCVVMPDRASRPEIDRDQGFRVRGEPKRGLRARELHDEGPASIAVIRPIPNSGLKRWVR